MRTKHVLVTPYDPAWVLAFAAIRQELTAALGPLALAIEHVGSTAVPGLWAKPILDIDVVIPNQDALPPVVQALAAIGYTHEGDLGIPQREAFSYRDKPHLHPHHLYVCPKDSRELHRHLTFRNYLRTHPEAVRTYSQVKAEAARLYPDSIEDYMNHKSACIQALYRACGLDPH